MMLLKPYFWLLVGIACGGKIKAISPRMTKSNKSGLGSSSFPMVCLGSKNCVDDDSDDNHANVGTAKTSNVSQPSKLDLYDSDELAGLLKIHQQLEPKMTPPKTFIGSTKYQTRESADDIFTGGLHDLILQTIGEIEGEGETVQPMHTGSWISDKTRTKISNLNITAIASDIDGTIIGFDQKVHPRTRDSLKAAQDSADIEWIFPATGKTRWGVRNSLGSELSSLTEGPGVYVQGLYCIGKSGEVVYEKKLTSTAVYAAERLASNLETALVAYDGDCLYSTTLDRTEVIELHEKWGEPASRMISNLTEYSPGVNKILLLDNNENKLNREVRPRLEELAKEYGCVVTQAVPTMLEILPFGCSKAKGVQMVCKHLGIDPTSQLMSIGDAENDVEMLKVSALGIAVGNSCSAARNASDVVLPLNCSEGGVGMALEEILGV